MPAPAMKVLNDIGSPRESVSRTKPGRRVAVAARPVHGVNSLDYRNSRGFRTVRPDSSNAATAVTAATVPRITSNRP